MTDAVTFEQMRERLEASINKETATPVRPGLGTEILSLERRIRKLYVRWRIRSKGGEEAYEKWRDSLLTDLEFQKKYRDEAAKKELWSQLVKEIQPFLFQETAASFPLPGLKKLKAKRTRGKRIPLWVVVCSILTILTIAFSSSANGESGAWLADAMRAVLGPTITAQIESSYLGFSDTTHQIQYHVSGSHVNAPWAVDRTMLMPRALVPLKRLHLLASMRLDPLSPQVTPALSGEGVWLTQEAAPAPYNYVPLDAKTFIRPDPSHPYAIVTLLQFDTRFSRLHMVAGTNEPGGPRGFNGPGVIPIRNQQANALLAAFNGGFKYADGQYGLMVNNTIYVPPQPQAATIAVTREGQVILGAWGIDPRLNSGNTDLMAWRQNASLLINNGTINPLTQDGSAWGGTILNRAYTWRSGIGLTTQGTLIYAAGAFLTAQTLADALHAAGAVMAMQTDINPYWVRAFLYTQNAYGTLHISKLNPGMYGSGSEYLYGTERDFFYLTRFTPPPV